MQEAKFLVALWLASLTPQAWAAVRVKGFSAAGQPVGTLPMPGPDSNRYQVAYSSFLATPTTQAAENFAPLQWRARSTRDDPSQDPLDHAYIPAIVNTQLVTPWVANDVAVKGTFPGINVNDEERANVRPPNPSLCVGDNYVVEVSDMVIKVWDMSGKLLAGPVTLTDFFGTQRSAGRFSNAFCVYDAADTGRFYISVLNYTLAGGTHLGTSQLLLAASASGNPTEGFLGPYSVPTTGLDPATGYKEVLHGLEGCKNANPALPNGCMASGPTVGIDQHGLWVGLNMYQTYSTITAGNYSAPLLLGISKASLLGGRHATPAYAAVTDWDRDTTFTLAPSLTQGASAHCTDNGGTVFVASSGPSLSQAAKPKSELLLWTISNTSTLSDPDFPRGGVPQHNGTATLRTWTYADPTAAQVVVTQPDGGTALDQGDSRLTQLSYSDGMLWTAAATAVLINGLGDPLGGAVWWALQPTWNQSRFDPKIISQGYVTVMGNHVIDPVITASSAGSGVPTGVLAASLVGPDYHLSPIWTPINMQLGAGAIHMPVVSKTTLTGPQGDDQASTLLHGRSAATTDANGLAWVTSEWAAGSPTQFCQSGQLLSYETSCTNWGTQITAVSIEKWP